MTTSLTLLALDPSTDVTGAALLRVTLSGPGEPPTYDLLRYAAFDATHAVKRHKNALTARRQRIRWTANQLAVWLGDSPYAVDLVACENGGGGIGGNSASEAMSMAIGAYLTIHAIADVNAVFVNRYQGCIAAGCGDLYRSGAAPKGEKITETQRRTKKAKIKAAVTYWAVVKWAELNVLNIEIVGGDLEAVADALSVGVAAGNRWSTEEHARAIEAAHKAAVRAQVVADRVAAKAAKRVRVPREKAVA